MSSDEYRSGDVFAGIHELARDLDARWPGMHDEPASPGPRRGPDGRFVAVDSEPPVPFVRVWPDGSGLAGEDAPRARDLVDTTGIRATLAKHLAWDESRNPPLFEEALKAVEEAT